MNSNVNPKEVFYFFLTSGIILALLALVFPENGYNILGHKIHFADIKDFIPLKSGITDDKTPVIIVKTPNDSADEPSEVKLPYVKDRKILNYLGDQSPLASFYTLLAGSEKRKIRIFHFGDSQIENDRISSFLREKWQSVLGGGGMGYLPANAWIPHLSAEHINSDNWVRYTAFGKAHPDIKHNSFGPYQSFARFTPVDTSQCMQEEHAWIEVGASKRGYFRTRNYRVLKILLGNNQLPFDMSIYENGTLLKNFNIKPLPESDTVIIIQLQQSGSLLRIDFKARHSPDVYGLSLESHIGLVLDNIPMRGSDGSSFSRSNTKQIQRFMRDENTRLIIMQFGGNALPYILDRQHAGRTARQLARQVELLSKLSGGAPILFIGPSDMGIKVKDKFITHPLLSDFRDSLVYYITRAGAAYYDLFEAMGGEGSMIRWVQSDPPLASTDYVHFTPAGARKAAEKLFEILEADKNEYFQSRSELSKEISRNDGSEELPVK